MQKDWRERFLNKKTILIVVALAVVIGVGAIMGLEKASDNPAFCSTCHNMKPYYDSWRTGNLLAKKHADAGVKCHDCHTSSLTIQAEEGIKFVTGDYKTPLDQRKFPRTFCLRCHDFSKVKTQTNFAESNPHDSHNGVQNCYLCHSMHRKSKVWCAQCHQFNWFDKLDESWAK